MKKYIRTGIWFIIFLIVSLFAYNGITEMTRLKVREDDAIRTFYKQEKDSIDVVFIGTSHVYHGISPMDLWNEYGMTSYNLGTGSQGLALSYYLTKEAIRTQHPSMIVLESWGARYPESYQTSNLPRTHMVVDSLPLGKTKIELYKDFVNQVLPKDERLEFYFPIIRNHGRWQDLELKDFKRTNEFAKGQTLSTGIRLQTEPPIVDECTELTDKNRHFLEKIIQLCNDNNTSLVIYTIPTADFKHYAEYHKCANSVIKMAEEYGIPAIDFEHYRSEIGIDYSLDFIDREHLNTQGSTKFTLFFGQWLKGNFEITDHRLEERYNQWNTDYLYYYNYLCDNQGIALEERDEDIEN